MYIIETYLSVRMALLHSPLLLGKPVDLEGAQESGDVAADAREDLCFTARFASQNGGEPRLQR